VSRRGSTTDRPYYLGKPEVLRRAPLSGVRRLDSIRDRGRVLARRRLHLGHSSVSASACALADQVRRRRASCRSAARTIQRSATAREPSSSRRVTRYDFGRGRARRRRRAAVGRWQARRRRRAVVSFTMRSSRAREVRAPQPRIGRGVEDFEAASRARHFGEHAGARLLSRARSKAKMRMPAGGSRRRVERCGARFASRQRRLPVGRGTGIDWSGAGGARPLRRSTRVAARAARPRWRRRNSCRQIAAEVLAQRGERAASACVSTPTARAGALIENATSPTR